MPSYARPVAVMPVPYLRLCMVTLQCDYHPNSRG